LCVVDPSSAELDSVWWGDERVTGVAMDAEYPILATSALDEGITLPNWLGDTCPFVGSIRTT
jgi:hypothetical protein